jgi:hypothetical protein
MEKGSPLSFECFSESEFLVLIIEEETHRLRKGLLPVSIFYLDYTILSAWCQKENLCDVRQNRFHIPRD